MGFDGVGLDFLEFPEGEGVFWCGFEDVAQAHHFDAFVTHQVGQSVFFCVQGIFLTDIPDKNRDGRIQFFQHLSLILGIFSHSRHLVKEGIELNTVGELFDQDFCGLFECESVLADFQHELSTCMPIMGEGYVS